MVASAGRLVRAEIETGLPARFRFGRVVVERNAEIAADGFLDRVSRGGAGLKKVGRDLRVAIESLNFNSGGQDGAGRESPEW